MKNHQKPRKLITIFMLFCFMSLTSQEVQFEELSGKNHTIKYRSATVKGKGLKLDDGSVVFYEQIRSIQTAHFEAYEKLMNKAARYGNVKIEFTGDQNLYAQRLEQLRNRRTGADAARVAGGVMTILGVISGSRELTSVGLVTNAAGQVARQINDDNTSNTQTAMLNDLDQRTKAVESESKQPEVDEAEAELNEMREAYGKENVDGLIELIEGDHEKALAYANVGALSKDANHRIASIWLMAMIEEDRKDSDAAGKHYEMLVTLEPDIEDVKDAEKENKILLDEVEKIRKEEY